MKYFSSYKWDGETEEISAEKAKDLLTGYWNEDVLNHIFKDEKVFRLYTPYRYVWSKTDDGKVLMPGFEGVSE